MSAAIPHDIIDLVSQCCCYPLTLQDIAANEACQVVHRCGCEHADDIAGTNECGHATGTTKAAFAIAKHRKLRSTTLCSTTLCNVSDVNVM